jgi:hypothetical protein
MSSIRRDGQSMRHPYTFIHRTSGQHNPHSMSWSRSSACAGVITGEYSYLVLVGVRAQAIDYARSGIVMEDAEP